MDLQDKQVQQGYSFPFMSLSPLSKVPVETPLPCLRLKREALCEEIASLLTNGAVWRLSSCRRTRGEFIPITSWLPYTVHTAEFHPFLNHRGLNTYLCVSKFHMMNLYCLVGSQGCLPACTASSTLLAVCLVHPQECRGDFIVYQWKVPPPIGLAPAPWVFTKLPPTP